MQTSDGLEGAAVVNINHDMIFLVDSNLKHINKDLMSNDYSCAKFYVPTLDQK